MAYAAVASLLHTLEQIRDSHRPMNFYDMQQIEQMRSHFTCLLEFLENIPPRHKQDESSYVLLEAKIRDKAYEAEDIVDLLLRAYHGSSLDPPLSYHIKLLSILHVPGLLEWGMSLRYLRLWSNWPLKYVVKDRLNILKEVEEINQQRCRDVDQNDDDSSTSSVEKKILMRGGTSTSIDVVMVGQDDDLLRIKDQLTGSEPKLQVVPIFGMGGIGKTTMAEKLYNDPCVVYRFDVRAWVTISQEYNIPDIFSELLSSLEKVNNDVKMLQESNDTLEDRLSKALNSRRYLIVMDDVWGTDSWDRFKRFFPNNGNSSRVILTTRLENVAVYAAGSSSPLHPMQLLNANESWSLLRAKVFGEECCPPELLEFGKKVAHRCKGLPLAIVVISGLLSKGKRTINEWENVAENLLSAVGEDANACYEILRLSYNHLPQHLKACFLYMGLFPENYRISVSKLVKLWIAEGFLREVSSKTLDEVAEEYLLDLIERSLVMIGRRRVDKIIKTVHVHDLLRDLCIREAQKIKFLHDCNGRGDHINQKKNPARRVNLDPIVSAHYSSFNGPSNSDHFPLFSQALSLVRNPMLLINNILPKYCFARSLLYTGEQPIPSVIYSGYIMLRILDVTRALLFEFPTEILKRVNLRYLAFPFHGEIPESISQLFNLETILFPPLLKSFAPCPRPLPLAIWSLQRLRHLKFHVWYLSDFPCLIPGWKTDAFLPNLRSLSEIHASFCTMEVLREVPNLKKLGIWMEKWYSAPFYVNNLHCLEKLEVLKCCVRSFPTYDFFRLPNRDISKNLVFPKGLKELSLRGCRIPWKDMNIVGSLPNLKRLKLRDYAFVGSEWNPIEGEFFRLNFLLLDGSDLVHWIAEDSHFPSLGHLILKNCWKLEKIPDEIGDIPTLELLEVESSSLTALNSAKKIAEEQRDQGNDILRVSISGA